MGFFIWLVVAAVCGSIARYVGRPRGHGKDGYWFGFFLGPLGILITALLTPTATAQVAHEEEVERERRLADLERRGVTWCVVFDGASKHRSIVLREINRLRREQRLPPLNQVRDGDTIVASVQRSQARAVLDRVALFGGDAHIEAVEPTAS